MLMLLTCEAMRALESGSNEYPVDSRSILVGLVGASIQASRTPRLHESEGRAQSIPYIYRLIDLDVLGLSVEELPGILTAAERLGFTGLNITYPCKQAVIALLDDLRSRRARYWSRKHGPLPTGPPDRT